MEFPPTAGSSQFAECKIKFLYTSPARRSSYWDGVTSKLKLDRAHAKKWRHGKPPRAVHVI
jgi:hypothetical protein